MEKRKPKRTPKEVGQMMAGGKALIGVAYKLLCAFTRLGGAAEQFHALEKPEQAALIDKMAQVAVDFFKGAATTVASAAAVVKDSFASLLAACKQDGYCNPDFTESRWPLEAVAPDEDEWEEHRHHFEETVTIEEGIRRLKEMEAKGEIRLIGPRRAMKWIAAHLDAQLEQPIILPLPAQNSVGGLVAPIFYRYWLDDFRRYLRLYNLGNDAAPYCGWLVLRKRPSVAG